MTEERIEASTEVAGKTIEQHREFLEERIDPDSGLLDKLLSKGTLSRKEHYLIKGKSSFYESNDLLLTYILEKQEGNSLIDALRNAEQTHIANYLNANAEYNCGFGEDWPLTEKEVSILDVNQERLVDLLELVDLLGLLHSTKVINKRQLEWISSKPTSHEKNNTLLEIVRRRSLGDYRQTITCLRLSNQSHIAEIFEEGGVLVRVHAKSNGENVTEAENEISTAIANMIRSGRSPEETNRILELVNLKVIGAKTGQSIVLYIYCKTIEALQRLSELFNSGRLKDSVELWFNHLLSRSQTITVTTLTVDLSTLEFQKMRTYFKEEERNEGWLKEKHYDDIVATQHHKEPNISVAELNIGFRKNCSLQCLLADAITVRAVFDFDPKQMSTREKYELQEMLELTRERRKTSREEQAVKDLTRSEEDQQTKGGTDESRSASEDDDDVDPSAMKQKQEDQKRKRGSRDSDEDEVDSCTEALPFNRGDKMETIPPAQIGDSVGWWLVRHLESGQLGFIPRNRVVIDLAEEYQPMKTTVNELPLELLDIILQKSYLHYALNGNQSAELTRDDAFLINRLSSVEFCWFQRLNRLRFKKTLWRQLLNFYKEFRKESIIFRTNRLYFVENIRTEGLSKRLRSADCLTDVESRLIDRPKIRKINGKTMKSFRKNNHSDFWHIIRSSDDRKRSSFIRSLHQSNQTLLTRISENGGVVVKATVLSQDEAKRHMLEEHIVQRLNALRDKTKPRSPQMGKVISQLRDDDIEILDSLLDRQAVVWIWCQSQTGLERLQKLYESNNLIDVFSDLTTLSTSSAEMGMSIGVSICRDQLKKNAVVCPIFVNFTERIDVREEVWGVTKLRNEIYVLCRPLSSSPHAVLVFEDRIPFHLKKKLEVNEIQELCDIGRSEKENCLYISDPREKCIWKITREADDQHKIIKWLTTDYTPKTLSVSSDGQLVVVNESESILTVYGSDAEPIRSIQLPRDMKNPIHAVETSIGNFIILHEWKEEEGESGSGGREREMWVVSELARDGQMVNRRFIPSDETQQLNSPRYLSLDSDDRVFVADYWNHSVILLESDLTWKQTICPTKEEEERKIRWPHRLCYDEEKKQLIVAGNTIGQGVSVYTLNRR